MFSEFGGVVVSFYRVSSLQTVHLVVISFWLFEHVEASKAMILSGL